MAMPTAIAMLCLQFKFEC